MLNKFIATLKVQLFNCEHVARQLIRCKSIMSISKRCLHKSVIKHINCQSKCVTLLCIVVIMCTLREKNFTLQKKWCYNQLDFSGHINNCLEFIGMQEDCHGVFINSTIHMTGGFTALHKNVPIIALMQKDYHKYVTSTHYTSTPRGITSENIAIFNRPTNFFHIHNQPMLIRYLLLDEKINYLIVKKQTFQWLCVDHEGNQKFKCDVNVSNAFENNSELKICYCYMEALPNNLEHVFSSGDFYVLKKIHTVEHGSFTRLLHPGSLLYPEAHVLEYEVSWLYTFGLLDQARIRVEACLVLNSRRVHVYQLLALVYRDMGDFDKMDIILKLCYNRIGKRECLKDYKQKGSMHYENNLI